MKTDVEAGLRATGTGVVAGASSRGGGCGNYVRGLLGPVGRKNTRILDEGNPVVTPDTTPPPHFSSRQRLILFVLLGAGFMVSVDFSILNVALPEVGAGVGLGLTGLPCSAGSRTCSAAANCSCSAWSC